MRAAHAAHFLAVAEEAEQWLYGADQVEWMDRLDADHDNLLTAVHWSVESGDAECGMRLGAALAWYWSMSTQGSDVEARLAALCTLPGEADPQARAVVGLMRAVVRRGADWTEQVGAAVPAVRDSGALDRYRYVAVLEPGAWLLVGDVVEMQRAIARGLAHQDPWVRAASLTARAYGAENGGDVPAAEEDMRVAASAFRAIGDRWGITQTISSLAGFRSRRGDHAGAIEVLEESAASIRQLRSSADLAPIVLRIGLERLRAGDLAGGRADLDRGWSLTRRGNPWQVAWALTGLAAAARMAGDLEQAHRHLAEAEEVLPDVSQQEPVVVLTTAAKALLALDEQRFDAARNLLATALEAGTGILDRPSAARIAEIAARWRLGAGEHAGAARMLGMAATLRGVLDEGDPDVRGVLAELTARMDPESRRTVFDAGAGCGHDEALSELRESLRP